jgi:dTDP-4-dehydrorhamnose 3,5-epimerase
MVGVSTPAWNRSSIPDAGQRTLPPITDERGSFTELWRSGWTREFGVDVRQANLSRSEPGVLRGLHFHERQADLWTFVDGRAFVALVDLRPRLADPIATATVAEFEMTPGSAVYIPAGVAHGFLALERVALLYMVTNEYDGTDEHGFAWNDPVAGIHWPLDTPILSRRDSTNPSLDEAIEAMRRRGTFSPMA